jgi:putative membrane protein
LRSRPSLFLTVLLIGYLLFWAGMAISPTDRATWTVVNILPLLLIGVLVGTHRWLPLSRPSYLLIAVFLTLHTIGAHYTYAKVPIGLWLEQVLNLHRNHFDRIVHFSFGLLMTYPTRELFIHLFHVRGLLLQYLALITPLGLSGFWEILESWFARVVRPELGQAALGSQGDIWDAQKDMAAALYGSIVCLALIVLADAWRRRSRSSSAEVAVESSLADSSLAGSDFASTPGS